MDGWTLVEDIRTKMKERRTALQAQQIIPGEVQQNAQKNYRERLDKQYNGRYTRKCVRAYRSSPTTK